MTSLDTELLELLDTVLIDEEGYNHICVDYPRETGVPYTENATEWTAYNYPNFRRYNQECVSKLSDDKKIMFKGICEMIKTNKFNFLDVDKDDDYRVQGITGLYFTRNKQSLVFF